MMKWNARRNSRKIHRLVAISISLPFLIVLITGLLLQVKKEVAWIQPISQKGISNTPSITFEQILEVSQSIPEAEISSWDDIDRLDVRPDKGMVKVRSLNNWELQIDTETAEILQIEFRRSDIIEAMHDGSWFADAAKYWIFLPTAVFVLALWVSGMYLYFIPLLNKRRNAKQLLKVNEDSMEQERSL